MSICQGQSKDEELIGGKMNLTVIPRNKCSPEDYLEDKQSFLLLISM